MKVNLNGVKYCPIIKNRGLGKKCYWFYRQMVSIEGGRGQYKSLQRSYFGIDFIDVGMLLME